MLATSRVFFRRLLLTGVLLAAPAAHADFNDGIAAFAAGDYNKAMQVFQPLATTSNHAYAQYFLGRMYLEGRGIERDPVEAAKWLRKAAEQSVKEAQYQMGSLYVRGEGVPKDMEQAYGWLSCAAHLGSPRAQEALAGLQLSAEEKTAADKLAEELIAKYGKTPATTSVTQ